MKPVLLIAGAAMLAMTAFFSSAPEAKAWGCEARGAGTSRGWSSGYRSRAEAQRRALYECVNRPRARRCVITYCDPRR